MIIIENTYKIGLYAVENAEKTFSKIPVYYRIDGYIKYIEENSRTVVKKTGIIKETKNDPKRKSETGKEKTEKSETGKTTTPDISESYKGRG